MDWFNFQSIYFSLWHFKRFWLSDYSKQWFILLSCDVRFSDIFLWVSLESQQRDLVLLSADQKAIRSDPSIPPTIRLRIKMQRNGFRFSFSISIWLSKLLWPAKHWRRCFFIPPIHPSGQLSILRVRPIQMKRRRQAFRYLFSLWAGRPATCHTLLQVI